MSKALKMNKTSTPATTFRYNTLIVYYNILTFDNIQLHLGTQKFLKFILLCIYYKLQ